MSGDKRRIEVVSAAIIRDGAYLITQRLERAVLPLMWEFPGGKVEAGETQQAALARELKYRLGVEAAGDGERRRREARKRDGAVVRRRPRSAFIVQRSEDRPRWASDTGP